MAGLCAEADYIFVPEDPPKPDWPERLCEQLSQARILYPPSFPCINQTHTRARLSTSLLRFIFRSALSVHAKSAKISLRQNSDSVPFCAFSFVLIRSFALSGVFGCKPNKRGQKFADFCGRETVSSFLVPIKSAFAISLSSAISVCILFEQRVVDVCFLFVL